MEKKRVVITGMGVVSCFGNDVNEFYQSLLEGKSGVSEITQFPCEEMTTRFAASIHDFNPEEYLDKKQARRVDKFISYAMAAGKKTLEMGNLDLSTIDKHRCGILIGSGMGGMQVFSDGVKAMETRGPRKVSPFFVPYIITNMAGGLLAMDLGFMGPNYSISTACATANNCIIAAANHIRNGDADLMLTGGVESPIIPIGLAGFCSCKALSQRNDEPQRASRPWDKGRDGFVMGEGAGVLMLESLEHAQKRGATILAEYLGGGMSCDAHHMTEPRPDGKGVSICIQNALRDAQVNESDVDHINAHATSTPAGDMVEVNALKMVFKDPSKIVMNGTKSMTGHSLGAAGGIEAVTVVKAITDKVIHPTINLEDPESDLGFIIPTKAREQEVNFAISNSFGFGGHNATIVIGKFNQ